VKPDVFDAESTVEKWDADYYHPIALRLYDRAIADMLELMQAEPGSTVLDAGCGSGVHSVRLARLGFRVRAVDISETMLAHARRNVESAGVADRVTLGRQDLRELDLPDASFRFAFSWGVLIHIPEAGRALDELARIIEPGGSLALYVSNASSFDVRLEALGRRLLGKPLPDFERTALGEGCWYTMDGQKLWVCRIDAEALVSELDERGFSLAHHRIGELSELQRRFRGLPRRLLLHLNNAAYRMRLSPRFASGSLFVFRKRA